MIDTAEQSQASVLAHRVAVQALTIPSLDEKYPAANMTREEFHAPLAASINTARTCGAAQILCEPSRDQILQQPSYGSLVQTFFNEILNDIRLPDEKLTCVVKVSNGGIVVVTIKSA